MIPWMTLTREVNKVVARPMIDMARNITESCLFRNSDILNPSKSITTLYQKRRDSILIGEIPARSQHMRRF